MKYFLSLSLFTYGIHASAQNLIQLAEAEQLLQKNNILILAEQYNISASQAAVIQAKIWEQPYLSTGFNIINPQRDKVLDVGANGQKEFAIQQLIYLGGKKKNEVEFARSNVVIAELLFEQLIRNLKYQLAQTFYGIYFDKLKIITLETQINKLDTLLSNYEIQARKGNIGLKEVVRLQSLVLNLKSDKNLLIKDVTEAQQTLSLLTGIPEFLDPDTDEKELIAKYQNILIDKDSLTSIALANNLEYRTAIKISESQDLLLRWQRSLNVPDLTLGTGYDQRGGAFHNQVNLTLGIPIPLWSRNKGNIKIAEAQVKNTMLKKDYKKLEVETQVKTLWLLWIQQQNQLSAINTSVTENLQTVYTGMVNNFQKRNITLLEFTDFMESYNETSIQINEIKKSWILASLSLNYIANQEIF